RFAPGHEMIVGGILSRFNDQWQMVHPTLVARPGRLADGQERQTVYPSIKELSLPRLRRLIELALDGLPAVPEWHDPATLRDLGLPGFNTALQALHAPVGDADLRPELPARRRLALDELSAHQLALALLRRHRRAAAARPLPRPDDLRRRVLRALPFALTAGQRRVLGEIDADLARPERMLRLLQGDVGSGKTLVALLAMLGAVKAGAQAAIMAPTALLARQHATRLGELLAPLGLEPCLLVGGEPAAVRRRTLQALADGEARVIVGTHALFQSEVAFQDLALVVIDEQHRFGVEQRLELLRKADLGHLLVMTATPIPRSLVLSLYGEMAVSELREKPPGRQRVVTRALGAGRLDDVVAATRRMLGGGGRVYWVCPAIEAGEEGDETAVLTRHAELQASFGDEVGLVHGRMPAGERQAAMEDFAAGRVRILVATTVIEVGVDVPAAAAIVIEEAERFGLAQLHQLRGRVGRGDRAGSCLLIHKGDLSDAARRRLKILRATDDGFEIAEEDLRLRGPGEVLGTRQSGVPAFRLVDFGAHTDLLRVAQDGVDALLAADRDLAGPRGRACRLLLRIFERDAAFAYLASG
ncbi:MAG TPA: ATP-dependent DNA helicase RecG, partial [Geminicoccaceae bacterium]